MDFKDYYKTLGVEPRADDKAIKIAYRKLARKYHPDVSAETQSEEKFKEVNEAYEVLKNPEKRAEYDELRQYASSGKPFEPPPDWQAHQNWQASGHSHDMDGFSDFFRSIFGSAGFDNSSSAGSEYYSPHEFRGRDIEMELPVFLEDTLSETTRQIEYEIPAPPRYERGISEIKKLNVKIHPGVTDGERIRLQGMGAHGSGKRLNGDLYLRVRLVPHPLFDVEGHNLVLALPLSPWEAALGSQVLIPTLSGKVQLRVPKNSQAGQKLRLKQKGLVRGDHRGDLIVVIKIVIPNDASGKLAPLWESLAEATDFSPRTEWE